MGGKADQKREQADWQDIVYSNMLQTEALAQIMVEKGLMTKEEYNQRVQRVHQQFMNHHPHTKPE